MQAKNPPEPVKSPKEAEKSPAPALNTLDTGGALDGEDLGERFAAQASAFVEHLEELRFRLIVSCLAFVAAASVGWLLVPQVLDRFAQSVGRLIFVAPAEAFFVRLKIAAAIGLLLALPIILYQAWRFVLPALFPDERQALQVFVGAGGVLFLLGLAFGYFVAYPLALAFFLSFGGEGVRPAIVASRHLGFFLGTTLSFGVAFQLPVVLLALVRLGVVTPERLRELRRVALFLAFVAAAVLTPADGVSQFLMAGPLVALYELTLLAAPRFVPPAHGLGNPL